jgi:hypothetical protein
MLHSVLGTDYQLENGIHVHRWTDGKTSTSHFGFNPDSSKRFMSVLQNVDSDKLKINIKFKGSIYYQLKDLEWYLDQGATLFSSQLSADKKEQMNSFREQLIGIIQALEQCGLSFVATESDYDKLNDNEKNTLLALPNFMNAEHDESEKQQIGKPGVVNFWEYKLILFRLSTGDGKFKWINPFAKNRFMGKLAICEEGEEPDIENAPVLSLFMLFGKEVLRRYANTDYEQVYESLTSSDTTPSVINFALNAQCYLISVFDEDETNSEALNIAHRFGDWIKENFDTDTVVLNCLDLNRIQIEKRENKTLTLTDFRRLDNISKSEDITHRFAAFTLLEEYDKAEQCLIEMNVDTLESLKTYPEYFLYAK